MDSINQLVMGVNESIFLSLFGWTTQSKPSSEDLGGIEFQLFLVVALVTSMKHTLILASPPVLPLLGPSLLLPNVSLSQACFSGFAFRNPRFLNNYPSTLSFPFLFSVDSSPILFSVVELQLETIFTSILV